MSVVQMLLVGTGFTQQTEEQYFQFLAKFEIALPVANNRYYIIFIQSLFLIQILIFCIFWYFYYILICLHAHYYHFRKPRTAEIP